LYRKVPVLMSGDEVDVNNISLNEGAEISFKTDTQPTKTVTLGCSDFNLWGVGVLTVNSDEKVITTKNWGATLSELGSLPLGNMTLQYSDAVNGVSIQASGLSGGTILPYNCVYNVPINQPTGAVQEITSIKLASIEGVEAIYLIKGLLISSSNDTFDFEVSVSVDGKNQIVVLGSNETRTSTSHQYIEVGFIGDTQDFNSLIVNLQVEANEYAYLGTGYDVTLYYKVFPQLLNQ
jgi:hypothetical protein